MKPLTIVKQEDGWYVDDQNNEDCRLCGPYKTKAEAVVARRGLKRFWHDYQCEEKS